MTEIQEAHCPMMEATYRFDKANMDREQLERTIRSNLVSYGLLVYQIEEIVANLADDIMEMLENERD